MTDTPPTSSPPSRLDVAKGFIGDLARPFAIIVTSYGAAHATIVIAHKVSAFEGAATFIGAVFLGVGALYGAKAWEVAKTGKQAADVEIAKQAPTDKP
jgi:hypothetical protein